MMRRLLAGVGRALRPVLRPEWADDQARLARLELLATQQARQMAESARRDAEAAGRLARFDELARAATVEALGRQVREVRRTVGAHLRMTNRALNAAAFVDEYAQRQYAIDRRVDRAIARGAALAGPWTGEVGFELLYWIPFLRRLKSRMGRMPVEAITRGGSGAWYGGIADRTIDAFDLVDVDAYRTETDRENRKQRRVSPFDRRLLRAARGRLKPAATYGGGAVIHPGLLYELLYPYWKDQLAARVLFDHLEFARLSAPAIDVAVLPRLPRPPYTAVRFYFSECFPDTPENRSFVETTIRSLARRGPVVLLSTPFSADDHHDMHAEGLPVATVADLMTPANNLAVQSAVIAGAQGFVGTYGGLSYLPPFYGVASIGCYSRPTFFPHHLDVARRVYDGLGAPALTVVDVGQRPLVASMFG